MFTKGRNVTIRNTSGGVYLQSARLSGRDVLEAGLDLRGGGSRDALKLTLSANGGRVSGVVLNEDKQPAGGAQVVLAPRARRRDRLYVFRSAVGDQSGAFVLHGIPPGEYKLFAWEDVGAGAWKDPEFLRSYERAGEKCEVQEGDDLSFELSVLRLDDER